MKLTRRIVSKQIRQIETASLGKRILQPEADLTTGRVYGFPEKLHVVMSRAGHWRGGFAVERVARGNLRVGGDSQSALEKHTQGEEPRASAAIHTTPPTGAQGIRATSRRAVRSGGSIARFGTASRGKDFHRRVFGIWEGRAQSDGRGRPSVR